MNTTGMLVATRRRPPTAGPANSAVAIPWIERHCAVSSPGLRTSDGSNAASAGMNTVLVIVESPTMQYTTAGAPSSQIVTAPPTMRAARTTSAEIITRLRSNRSAKEPVRVRRAPPGSSGSH